jgi:hypothetical protein
VEERLDGGLDRGAILVDGSVRRPARAWTASVHHLLRYLEQSGFAGAPRVLGIDKLGREALTYLPGSTVGNSRPWPAWTHSDAALVDVGRWLREYHRVVATYVPPIDSVWRERRTWRPGMIIGHGDPAPYNAVWNDRGLVGFIDWDNAGPMDRADDLAWVAFSWTPLHARAVVVAEGFQAFSRRKSRLERFLRAYAWDGTLSAVVDRVGRLLDKQVSVMRAVASSGDPAYEAMLRRGQDRLLERARAELADLA